MVYSTQSSPRKVVPLASGNLQRTRSEPPQPSITKRAYFCGVVIEQSTDPAISQDIEEIVASLGPVLSSVDEKPGNAITRSASAPTVIDSNEPDTREYSAASTTALNDIINELVSSERSYVNKLRIMKRDYADPLRNFSKQKESTLLPGYEANTLFGNIDAILPANEAFLTDLERMLAPNGSKTVGGVGDVALKHLRDLRAFDCYKTYYAKREEAQSIFEKEMAKRPTSAFASYIDAIKYSSESKNRVGLRELLIEPIQRIPRYTLMFRIMIKNMSPSDPQRAKLIEADEVASKIALAETDEQTKRATIMHCLERTIEGFPPNLMSSSRRFIDCIDVEDVPVDGFPQHGDADRGEGSSSLHCTLFLFDDRMLIVKRPNGNHTGRHLTGLEELERAARNGGIPTGIRRGILSCKGVVDITEVVATDVGNSEFHIYLENPPADQLSDKWSNRPFRSYAAVRPPSSLNSDSVQTKQDKLRFLENVWKAQALYRARHGRSFVTQLEERELPLGNGGKRSVARTYFNVYQRTEYLMEPKKNKIVLHIDSLGSADPLPFGVDSPPYVIARAQPMAGELCRYSVVSSDPNDEGEEDIVHTTALPNRVTQTIHQFGLYHFRTSRTSAPSTPTAGNSSRSRMFRLDTISRNFLSASTDVFGTISGSTRRPRSRTSTLTTATESSAKFSQRSTSTAGTSTNSSMTDDDSLRTGGHGKSILTQSARKLIKRGRSPGTFSGAESGSEMDVGSPRKGRGRKSGRREPDYDDEDEFQSAMMVDSSEMNLTAQLELARKNSQSQNQTLGSAEGFWGMPHYHDRMALEESRSKSSTLAVNGSSSTIASEYNESSSLNSATPTQSLADAHFKSRGNFRKTETGLARKPVPNRSPSRSPELKAVDIERALSQMSRASSTKPPSRATSPQPSTRPTTPSTFEPVTPVNPKRTLNPDDSRPLPPLPGLLVARQSSSASIMISELEDVVSPGSSRETYDYDNPTPRARPAAASSESEPFSPSKLAATPSGGNVVPLMIKKRKTQIDRPPSPPSPGATSPLDSLVEEIASKTAPSPRRMSVQLRSTRTSLVDAINAQLNETESHTEAPSSVLIGTKRPHEEESNAELLFTSTLCRENVTSSLRAMKKIKLELDSLKGMSASRAAPSKGKDPISRIQAGVGLPRSPPIRQINKTSEREARMEEMRMLIGNRPGRYPLPLTQQNTGSSTTSDGQSTGLDHSQIEQWTQKIDQILGEVDHDLQVAQDCQGKLHSGIEQLVSEVSKNANEANKLRGEVGRTRRQCDLVKKLLADATAENEIVYEAFNEELDNMYNDINLPDDEAWEAMTKDLRQAKDQRNTLAKENSQLKRKLEEMELQNQEWEKLLRNHGLIS
ncbi:hypothetical protein FRC02_006279 [Tulasnella sp. 418]|nr:hypothetical protein FRC02_006279 [Tulasnella sp. 418]